MQIIAYQKNYHTTPRKLRLVADMVRNMHPTQALLQLKFMHKLAATPLAQVLNQAIKNAVNNNNLEEKNLKIKHILIEEGPRYKRWRAASRGRARTILKRTSHIKVVLEHTEPKPALVPAKINTAKTKKTKIDTAKTKKIKKDSKDAQKSN